MWTCLSWPRVAAALLLLLPLSCATSPGSAAPGARREAAPKLVQGDALSGGRLRLSFEPVSPVLDLEVPRVEEARESLVAFHASFQRGQGTRLRLVRTSAGLGTLGAGGSEEWEPRLREEFLSRYGPSRLPLPQSLETSRLFMALKLSPRYMGEGVREAARELFSSPLFLSSVALSVFIYFAAWLAPEPIFTKAFVAALTLRLTLAVGAWELTQVARACLQLYQEAEAARTVQELEAAAERFGKAMGGTGLRVLMLVASMGMAKGLPEVPQGGLGALLRAPRYSLPGGMTMGARRRCRWWPTVPSSSREWRRARRRPWAAPARMARRTRMAITGTTSPRTRTKSRRSLVARGRPGSRHSSNWRG
jgi:hypothetical protein